MKPAETNKDHAEYSDDEFHARKDWMMNHKTDGFWKSEFSESVDVGCETSIPSSDASCLD